MARCLICLSASFLNKGAPCIGMFQAVADVGVIYSIENGSSQQLVETRWRSCSMEGLVNVRAKAVPRARCAAIWPTAFPNSDQAKHFQRFVRQILGLIDDHQDASAGPRLLDQNAFKLHVHFVAVDCRRDPKVAQNVPEQSERPALGIEQKDNPGGIPNVMQELIQKRCFSQAGGAISAEKPRLLEKP